MAEEIWSEDTGIIAPFYVDDAFFYGSACRSAQLIKLLMEIETDWGYFPEPSKSLFIADFPYQEEMSKREFVTEGLELNFVGGS